MIRVVHKTKGYILMREVFPANSAVQLHTHRNRETFYIRKGHGYFHMDGKIIEIQQGSIVAVPPGVVHGIETFGCSIECVVTVEGNHADEIDGMYEKFTRV